MKNSRNRTMATLITLFLMSTIAVTLVALPAANAHTPAWQIPTFAYVQAAPNPIGVGQTTLIYMWLGNPAYPSASLYNDYRYRNYILTITAPDGKVQTQTFAYVSDPTNSQYLYFTPDQVGTYQLNFTYQGQAVNAYPHANDAYANDTFLPSSNTVALTVQQEPIPAPINSYPLPAEYWTRPIYGENTDWWSISSNWLGSGSPVISATGAGTISAFSQGSAIQYYPGDAVGPQTGHVMWTKPLEMGGVVGGNDYLIPGVGFFEGSAYSQRFSNPIIIDGYLYYTEPVSFTGSTSGPTDCVDLRTGKLIWSTTIIPALSFGYIYSVYNPNQHGVYPPILFTSNFARAFDAYTGYPLFNVTGVPTGATAMGPQGEQLRLVLANAGTSANPQWYLSEWNSSRMWDMTYNPWTGGVNNSPTLYNDSTTSGSSLTIGQASMANVTEPAISTPAGTHNDQPATSNYVVYANVVNSASPLYSYDWNVSIPWRNNMTLTPTVVAAFYNNMLLCRNGSLPALGANNPYTFFAVNLNASRPGYSIGSLLWMHTYDPPLGNITLIQGGYDPVSNVFVLAYKETMRWIGISLTTGQQLWGPTPPQNPWDYYGNPGTSNMGGQVAYGNLYSSSFGGILYCYNLTTGRLEWTYGNGGEGNSTYAGFENTHGHYPTFIAAVGNGVIYLVTAEHTITDPIYKGALARAVNATNGQEIWTLPAYTYDNGVSTEYAIADGFATFWNGYDDTIYCVGRGPSATTVSAPDVSASFGTPIVIKGTVMDISAGTKQDQQAADFPNGVPAVSDASMKDWMGYVYQQKPRPINAIGVNVTLSVLDSNGNFREIGTVMSDSDGFFSYQWTPDIPGKYTVIATFAGSEAYWPSHAETAMVVQEPAATPTPAPAAASLPPFDLYILIATVAIIIAIAIVGLMILRKRP